MEEQLANALADVAAASLRADMAEKETAEAKARADKAEAERDSATAALAASEKVRTDSLADIPRLVQERVSLEVTAKSALGADSKFDGMTDRAIRVATVKKLDGADLADDKSDDYVIARFDAAIAHSVRADKANANLRSAADGPRADVSDALTAARAQMLRDNAAQAKG